MCVCACARAFERVQEGNYSSATCFKYRFRLFVVIHVYNTNEKIHLNSKYSVTNTVRTVGGVDFFRAVDLLALTLIPKLAIC